MSSRDKCLVDSAIQGQRPVGSVRQALGGARRARRAAGQHAAKAMRVGPAPGSSETLRTAIIGSAAAERVMRRTTAHQRHTDEPQLDRLDWQMPIYTKQTNAGRGRGAYAARQLVAGELVGEYAGEIITETELNTRVERQRSEYLFDLGCGLLIDARRYGNATRRINHCALAPNVRAQLINGRGVRKVCIYTKCNVEQHAELLFDYGPLFMNDAVGGTSGSSGLNLSQKSA